MNESTRVLKEFLEKKGIGVEVITEGLNDTGAYITPQPEPLSARVMEQAKQRAAAKHTAVRRELSDTAPSAYEDIHDPKGLWDRLDRGDKLQNLKDNAPDLYQHLRTAKFGKKVGAAPDLSDSDWSGGQAKVPGKPHVAINAYDVKDPVATWNELDRADKLEALMESNYALYKALYKAKFGKEHVIKTDKNAYVPAFKLSDDEDIHDPKGLWDRLDRGDKLQNLKDNDPGLFGVLYKAKFGKDHPDTKKVTPIKARKFQLSDDEEPREKTKKESMPKELFMEWDDLERTGRLDEIFMENLTLYFVLYFDEYGYFPERGWTYIDHHVKDLYQAELRQHKLNMYSEMSWDELFEGNLTNKLKKLSVELYKQKYYQKYGRQPVM